MQVNTSRGGIPKRPIFEGILTFRGLDGDAWAHPQIHGGPKQAVLLISNEEIEKLKAGGFPVYAGALGENLTTEGLPYSQLRAGQRFRAGTAVLELTKLRRPCDTLSVYGPGIQAAVYDQRARNGDTSSPHWAIGGFYAAVISPGMVKAGDEIALLEESA